MQIFRERTKRLAESLHDVFSNEQKWEIIERYLDEEYAQAVADTMRVEAVVRGSERWKGVPVESVEEERPSTVSMPSLPNGPPGTSAHKYPCDEPGHCFPA